MTYKNANLTASLLCFIIGFSLLFFPNFIYWIFGTTPHDTADFIAKRAAMLFFGFTTLCYLSRNLTQSQERRAISAAITVAMAGLALSGIYEFSRGFAGVGIWLEILTELAFAGIYARFWSQAS